MLPSRVLVFDFDGVLVDGMAEYWWSARRAAMGLDPTLNPPEAIPADFVRLRPLLHKGWEMVLIAAELTSPATDLTAVLTDYQAFVAAALQRRGWRKESLQQALEGVRRDAIATDRQAWLALHRFYPGVVERLERLTGEEVPWLVLTTKGAVFAAQLLESAGLTPLALYGHEQGSKPDVLLRLARERPERVLWFIEDRRPTLELVRVTPGLEKVRCFLVAWGYLTASDRQDLPDGITLLERDRFAAPLADWP